MYSYCIGGIVGGLLSLWSVLGERIASETQKGPQIDLLEETTVHQFSLQRKSAFDGLFYGFLSNKKDNVERSVFFDYTSSLRQKNLRSVALQYRRTARRPTTAEILWTEIAVITTTYQLSLHRQPALGQSLYSFLSARRHSVIDNIFYEDTSTYPSTGHTLWTKLLKTYVNEKGLVDYARWRREPTQLRAYLTWLRKNVPTKDRPRTERLAYWINLYNAFTIELILRNYPVKSIRDIRTQSAESPWKIDFINLPTAKLSLDNVENDIIRKHFLEPRIHFALVCAAVSCPPLRREAYLSNRLSVQLDDQARRFLQDPTKNRTKSNQLRISELFKWFEKDFKQGGGVLNYISKYVKSPLPVGATISYMTYDWGLNEQK